MINNLVKVLAGVTTLVSAHEYPAQFKYPKAGLTMDDSLFDHFPELEFDDALKKNIDKMKDPETSDNDKQ